MKLKFQQSYLEKHSAYYTAQFPILSQVRTQTLTLSHRIQNESAAQNNLPERLSDTKTHRQKGKTAILWGSGGGSYSSNYSYSPLLGRNNNNIFHSIKRTCIAQTEMVISITLHEAAVWWNGVAARQRQAPGHYATPECGTVIAVGEYNQVLCLSLL